MCEEMHVRGLFASLFVVDTGYGVCGFCSYTLIFY